MTRRILLDVDGMHCDDCIKAIADALAALPGVSVQRVRIGSAELQVDDTRCSLGDIVDAVAGAGYVADERTPDSR